jgi:hypothetical protein
MRFGERAAWWRDGAERDVPHEGLDIGWFRSRDGRRLPLGPGARVPVLWGGEIVAIVPDFLGRSVFVAHGTPDGEDRRLHTVYGHIDPCPGLAPGSVLSDGDELGTLARSAPGKTTVPPHLHLTLALIAREVGPAQLGWEVLRDCGRVLLLDPLPIVCGTMRPLAPDSGDEPSAGETWIGRS